MNEIGTVNVVCESFVITENHDAYTFFSRIIILDVVDMVEGECTFNILSLWKIILTQQKTKISHRNQIERIQRLMHSKLDITWKQISDINYQIKMATKTLKEISKSAASIRTQHLAEKASALNIRNQSSSAQTIINIQKIEQVIKIWRTIKYVTINKNNASLKTVDIPVDGTIK